MNSSLVYIVDARYQRDYILAIRFSTGEELSVDFKNELDLPVFEPLLDLTFFKSFKVNSWTIYWDNGADFAPEFVYELGLKQCGREVATA
jgi:hypothetical protein